LGSTEEAAPLELGYWLSSEEHRPGELVEAAVAAEAAGFAGGLLSDHLHPWTPAQGNAPFAWAVLGAIAARTGRLRLGTGVSSAVHRVHPVVLAHAAATVAVLAPGRFTLGLGTGERLNEATGERWPAAAERREMLRETVEVVRRLFDGGVVNHRGTHFRVERARLYTVPDTPPDLLVAAGGSRSAALAGELGAGLLTAGPDPAAVDAYLAAGGHGRRVVQLRVCWAADEAEARRTALRWWPIDGLDPVLLGALGRPEEFAAASRPVTEDDVASRVVCGPDAARHLAALARCAGAGYTEVYVHQVGPDQLGFVDFYAREVLPRVAGGGVAAGRR
jgi:G6PDH family F420-dependent oxidoreductase